MTHYTIVEFLDHDECEAVPSGWVDAGDRIMCWWPPFKTLSKVLRSIQQHELPNPATWTQYHVRILGNAGKHCDFIYCCMMEINK